jgi:hypothetical protein
MSGTSDKLILKAGRRLHQHQQDPRKRIGQTIEVATLVAFGEVAADVLGICMTPHAFCHAVRVALAAVPMPNDATRSRDAAEANRAVWEKAFVIKVHEVLD